MASTRRRYRPSLDCAASNLFEISMQHTPRPSVERGTLVYRNKDQSFRFHLLARLSSTAQGHQHDFAEHGVPIQLLFGRQFRNNAQISDTTARPVFFRLLPNSGFEADPAAKKASHSGARPGQRSGPL